jgi:hypothetical protein
MKAAEYEYLISEIAKGICQSAPDLQGLTLGTGHKNHILGASGYAHQIDVSLQETGRTFLIECKRWKDRIGVAEVLVLAGRASDIKACHPGCSVTAILVSIYGASRGAQQLARHFGINIEIATSAFEYGLRIGGVVHHAILEEPGLFDHTEATVTRQGVIINE